LAGKEISSDLVRQEKSSIKTLDIASTQPIEYYLGAVIIESENLRETVITNDSISNPSETLAMSEFNSEQKNTQESLNKTKDKSIRPKKKDKSVSAVSDSENKTLNQQPAEMLETNNEALIKKADKMPEFPGGTQGLILYLQEHLHYPSSDKLRGIQGNLYISFIIEENGKISSVEILKGLGGECDSEAVKAVSSMPDWQPGIVDGKPVRVRFTLPITFQLNK
jgi:TonB family protein